LAGSGWLLRCRSTAQWVHHLPVIHLASSDLKRPSSKPAHPPGSPAEGWAMRSAARPTRDRETDRPKCRRICCRLGAHPRDSPGIRLGFESLSAHCAQQPGSLTAGGLFRFVGVVRAGWAGPRRLRRQGFLGSPSATANPAPLNEGEHFARDCGRARRPALNAPASSIPA
jgi:hypothetical protein